MVIALATAIVITGLALTSLSEVIAYSLILGIGFTLSVSLVNAITPTVHKPLILGIITGVYHTLGILLSAVIVFLFI